MSDEKTKKEANPLDAQYGKWDEDFKTNPDGSRNYGNSGDKKKIEWMKFDKPGMYRVRLVGKYVKYMKHYKPFGFGTRVITHKSYKGQDPAWNAGFYPSDSFAIHMIDRATGKLKILDKGRKLFEYFFDYGTSNQINPAGPNAPDFDIKAEWPNGNKKQAKYTATAVGVPAALTKEELEMVQASNVELGKIYRATTLEKIKELWETIPEDYRIPKRDDKDGDAPSTTVKAKSAAAPEPIEESMENAPAEDDELFGKEEKKEEASW